MSKKMEFYFFVHIVLISFVIIRIMINNLIFPGFIIVSTVFSVFLILLRPLWADIKTFLHFPVPILNIIFFMSSVAAILGYLRFIDRMLMLIISIFEIVIIIGFSIITGRKLIFVVNNVKRSCKIWLIFLFMVLVFWWIIPYASFYFFYTAILLWGILGNLSFLRVTALPVPFLMNEQRLRFVFGCNRRCSAKIDYSLNNEEIITNQLSRSGLKSLASGLHYTDLILEPQKETSIRYQITLTPVKRIFSTSIIKSQNYKLKEQNVIFPSFQQELSFLAFADLHGRSELFKNILLAETTSQYDLIFLNGDISNNSESPKQLANDILKPLAKTSTPVIFSRGNHEARGEAAMLLADTFADNNGRLYRSFLFGSIYLLVLDTGEDKDDSHPEYSGLIDFEHYHAVQAKWLSLRLSSPAFLKAKYRLVVAHIPPVQKDIPESLKKMFSLLNGQGISAMLSGHTHHAEILHPDSSGFDYQIVISGAPKTEELSYIRGRLGGETSAIEIVRKDGQIIDSLNLV
ncbi:MAG: metallophosphoesterase [Spirochaetales bacterium]|nr:metallophosphoesterase [Spirochaetales bacterium]